MIQHGYAPETNWWKIDIDHVKPIFLFDASNNEESKKNHWLNNQPLLKKFILKKIKK